MLYPTSNQPLLILIIFFVGLLCGLMFDGARLLTLLSGADQYSRHILEFIATVLSIGVLFVANLKFNYGQFRVYVLAIFLISFTLEQIISRFLWTNLLKKWYSSIVQRRKRFGKRKEIKSD